MPATPKRCTAANRRIGREASNGAERGNPFGPTVSEAAGTSLIRRAAAAVATGLVSAALTWYLGAVLHPEHYARDFFPQWFGARVLLQGHDPWAVVRPVPSAPYNYPFAPLFYPMPAVLVALPFAALSPFVAAAAFLGVSAALLAWGITGPAADETGRGPGVRWPLFLSAAFFHACYSAQWTPLLAAATLLPALSWLAAVKPTTGLAVFSYRPSWRTVGGVLAVLAVSFAVRPGWLAGWLGLSRAFALGNHYVPPALVAPLLLLALTRWRRPEARMLTALAIAPQQYYLYDALFLWLVPTTRRQAWGLTAASWAAEAIAFGGTWQQMIDNEKARIAVTILGLYLPCLILVLRRPNTGPAPAWAESVAAAWEAKQPRWVPRVLALFGAGPRP